MGNDYGKITSKEILGYLGLALEAGQGNLDWVNQIGLQTTSDSAKEKYGWLGNVPKMREWKGSREAKQLLEHDYSITNKKYEATLRVELDDLARDKTGQLKTRIGQIGEGSADHWAELVSALIENYASYTCYDGKAFFAATHGEGDSGTVKNLLTATEVTKLDVTTATAPTAAECSDALLEIVGYMQSFKDDQGRPINRTMQNLVVMCGNIKIYSPMLKAASSDLINSGGAAIDNVLRKSGFTFSVVYNPFLTASSWTTAFTVYRGDAPVKPFILQSEADIVPQVLAEGSDFEMLEDAWLFGIKAKRAAGYGLWQYAAHCTLS